MQHPFDDVAIRHLARVVESSDDAIVSKDLNGIITSWNRAAERMFGYTAAEIIGQSIRIIIPADRQGEEDMVLSRIRSGEALTHFETIRRRKDGTLLPISLTVSPIHDDSGRVIGASKIARNISERVEAEIIARRLAAIVESSDDAIISKDLNGVITSWNRAAERMFGYTANEVVGQSIRLIIPPDRQSEEDAVLARIRVGESLTHFETVRQRKDGTLIPISLTVSPIVDGAGHVIGASKIARDLSERDRGEIASRRLRAVVESSDDAIITKDLNGTITSWNPAAERMFGYTEAEALGRSIRMLIPDELQEEEDLVLARIRAGEKIEHYQTIRQHRDGTRLTISLTVSPIRDQRGEIVGASKVARDITERARMLAAAREHASHTEKLGEVGAVVASTLDRETIVQKVTDIATELTRAEFGAFFYNVTDAESGDAYMLYTLSGAPREAFAKFPNPRATAIFAPTFHGEGPVRFDDVTADPRYGKSAPYFGMPPGHLPVRSYLAVPVKGIKGEVLGGLFFGHSQVAVFGEQHERLAAGVAAWASVALENARLYADAQAANRTKDEFLAVLSHELRTPLNAIVGYSRLLRGGILSGEKATRGLETLERNATWLTQIVEDVLDVSRIVAGKIRLDVQPVELPVLIDNAVATVQPAADAKGVRLQTLVDPGVGPVSGDPGRLQQVVWNLLSNAVKFTPKKGRVQVRLERVNSHVEVIVSDTGIGIRPDFLPYVFERFRQADAGPTRKSGGLGLGLAIVRHIVEMHGGTVEAFSEGEGKGATFHVRLPLMILHPQALDLRREHPRTERREALSSLGDLTGIHVLAVDDEDDALTLLRVVLEAAGAVVTTIASPLVALERIAELRPDVIVVDLGMPEMDGFELIKRVRTSTEKLVRRVPAAALTAFARSEDRTKALQSGFEMHLAKPVDPGELVASIATLARRTKADN
ncbi:MAG TPA: PAS domain S-box protein [Vicinamibacterales bacterium]|nr:PAS domain S-box protein [Vicinamibacterales bacterium]